MIDLALDPADGQGDHWLYEYAQVMRRLGDDDGVHLTVRVAPDQVERVKRRFAEASGSGA